MKHGVHTVNGPLKLANARHVKISGESPVTTLHLIGTDGSGGIVLTNAAHIEINNLLIVGQEVPAVVQMLSNSQDEASYQITLRNTTIVNLTPSNQNKQHNAAVKLSNVQNVCLESCRLVADIGIIGLLGDSLPQPSQDEVFSFSEIWGLGNAGEFERAGRNEQVLSPQLREPGVKQLKLHDVGIRYQTYGIWAVTGEQWNLSNCNIAPIPSESPPDVTITEADVTTTETNVIAAETNVIATEISGQSDADLLRSSADLLQKVDKWFSNTSPTKQGTAIKVFLWLQCQVRECILRGKYAVETGWWIGGAATGNTIEAQNRGFSAYWLHEAQWEDNEGTCAEGVVFALGGCHRASISSNKVCKSNIGIGNLLLPKLLDDLLTSVQEIRSFYSTENREDSLVIWLLLSRLVQQWELQPLADSPQKAPQTAKINLPDLLAELLYLLYPKLRDIEIPPQLPLPLIALQVRNNDIEAVQGCVHLQRFWTLGGISICHNRLHTITGQALTLNSNPQATNVHLIVLLWRYLMTTPNALSVQLK